MTSTQELQRQAEQDRSRVAETLNVLRERMEPSQIVDQAIDYARNHGGMEFVRNLSGQVKSNPLPLALIAAGLGWLMYGRPAPIAHPSYWHRRARSNEGPSLGPEGGMPEERLDSTSSNYRTGADAAPPAAGWSSDAHGPSAPDKVRATVYGSAAEAADRASGAGRDAAGSLRGKAQGVSDSIHGMSASVRESVRGTAASVRESVWDTTAAVGDTARAAAETLGDRARDVHDYASDLGRSAADRARDARRRARYAGSRMSIQAERARDTISRVIDDQPLVVGAVGLAIGAILGAALSRTRREDEIMGKTRDHLVAAARDTATDRAREGWAEAQAAGSRIIEKAKEEAESQGLVPDSAAGVARGIGDKVEAVVGALRAGVEKEMKSAKEKTTKGLDSVEAAASSDTPSSGGADISAREVVNAVDGEAGDNRHSAATAPLPLSEARDPEKVD